MRLRADAEGEGSRGGRVIGHTATGRPIYESHSHPAHEKFSIVEHQAAAEIHERKALSSRRITRNAKDPGMRASGERTAKTHDEQAALHNASVEARRKPAKPPSPEVVKARAARREENIRARELARRPHGS